MSNKPMLPPPLEGWFLFFAALTGACTASFMGMAVYRLPHILGWVEQPDPEIADGGKRSHCENCKAPVPPLYLVPVIGWLLAGGRCARCRAAVSPVYPLMEAATGALSGAVVWHFGATTSTLVILLLLWALIFLAWMDLEQAWIPEIVSVPLVLLGLVASPFEPDWLQRLEGGGAAFAMMMIAFGIVSLSRRENIFAGGDVALATVGGAWLGWTQVPFLLFLAAVFFTFHAAPLRARGVVWVPMGPALALAIATLAVAPIDPSTLFFR